MKLAPYLHQPKAFVCPADKTRQVGLTNYVGFNNNNLSYFASLNVPVALTSSPAIMILAGDRHLAFHNQPVQPGLFSISDNAAMSWTKELHHVKDTVQTVGVLQFWDGHNEAVKSYKLPAALQNQGLVANRLVIP